MKKFVLDFRPTFNDYKYVHTWMTVAYKKGLPNSDLIKNISYEDFKKGRIVVYKINGKAEAFMLYYTLPKVVVFQILYLNYKYHHKGIGRQFMHELIEHFKNEGKVVAEAFQPSLNGLRLVKELGFVSIEDNRASKDFLTKFLVDPREQSRRAKRRLVLWKNYERKKRVDYSWSLNFSRDKRPILTYAYKDWTYGIVDNGITKPIDVVKNLEDNHCGEYLYLDEDIFHDLDSLFVK